MISHAEYKIKKNTKILDTENRSVIDRGKGWKGEKWVKRKSKGEKGKKSVEVKLSQKF